MATKDVVNEIINDFQVESNTIIEKSRPLSKECQLIKKEIDTLHLEIKDIVSYFMETTSETVAKPDKMIDDFKINVVNVRIKIGTIRSNISSIDAEMTSLEQSINYRTITFDQKIKGDIQNKLTTVLTKVKDDVRLIFDLMENVLKSYDRKLTFLEDNMKKIETEFEEAIV